ncbi:predicted protein [Sparassis crispa]|uniref:Uncharacterized protein n=1 Tax=Sparassis crispa TaxID=139825 RepID=A0A401G7X3_9APHY|nr:predicted protein [Sparassis crispa]GBE78248.1 predicted protein [Sparassis crispa]
MPPRYSNSSAETTKKENARKTRAQSASEIARNVKSFETWATYQGCEEVEYNDLPAHLAVEVKNVFDVSGRLPDAWLDKSSRVHKALKKLVSAEFMEFIRSAHDASPELFTSAMSEPECRNLLCDIQSVFVAWTRLQKMRNSSRKWSEADYTANVYNVFRSPAARESDYRAQCSVSLSQPLSCFAVTSKAVRALNAKAACPDSSFFIPTRLIRELSHSARSPFKLLKAHPSVVNSGSVGGESSFRFQSTPCTKLPDTPGFEFASTFWEDKKPVHHMLDDAYRQNRMATTSAVRQLHSLHVQAPIFGLVWARGTVRAHVDWWTVKPNSDYPSIQSAAYPGANYGGRRTSDIFHEWQLDEPSDILQVYLLVRNMDHWTVNGFCERVISGIKQLATDVVENEHAFVPWKRKGDLGRSIPTNIPRNPVPAATPSPPRRKPGGRARR